MRERKENYHLLSRIDKSWTLFLDRDGVINERIVGDYVRNISQFKFIPGTIEALKILRKIFGRIIIVTNQRGIARGLMTEEDLISIHDYMLNELRQNDVTIDGVYYCPHDITDNCSCRKPKPGMAFKARIDFPDIDFAKSIVVGDSESDVQFAINIAAIPVLISSGGKQSLGGLMVFDNLAEYAGFIRKLIP
uniref:D,D-heptose 1,7-bisphosphate phosphatase n=1 Tax=Fervidobacterium pennivorans TaxID=93466 RepID=A0A7V4KCB5_FERPE